MGERLRTESVSCVWQLLSDTHRKGERINGSPVVCVCHIYVRPHATLHHGKDF